MQDSQSRLAAINGLRAVAILGVVWHHTVYKLWLAPQAVLPAEGWREPVAALLNSGWLGVNLFFVLSGFVLYLPYATGRRHTASLREWAGFYGRRATRLLPLFYLSLIAFGLIDIGLGRNIDLRQWLAGLTLTFNFSVDTFFPQSNWVLWSLGIEIWFSLLFPLLVYLIARHGIGRVLVAVLIVSLLMRVVGSSPAFLSPGDRLNPIKDGILGRLDDFLVGMWLCDAYVRNRLEHLVRGPVILTTIIAGVVSCALWERVIAGAAPTALIPLLHNGIQLGCIGVVAAALRTGNLWTSVLSNSLMQVIGMMCFSIYVWHGRPIELLLQPGFSLPRMAVYIACIAAISAISYRFIEFPAVKPWQSLFTPVVADAAVANQRR